MNGHALLFAAWFLALLNLTRIFATDSGDTFGIIINAAVLLGAPVLGIVAAREDAR